MKSSSGSKFGPFFKSLVSLLIGALISALVVTLLFSISLARTRAADPDAPSNLGAYLIYLLSSGAIVFLFAFVFTSAATFILGLPLALVMVKFRLIRWWSSLLAGFLIGFIPALWVSWPDLKTALMVGGGLGAIGGLTAWLVWHFLVERSPSPQVTVAQA